MSEITLGLESPCQPEVARLREALDAYQSSLYPPESNHFLDMGALAAPSVLFFVAWRGREAVGCGALRIDGAGYVEREAFGEYKSDPLSVFMEKRL
jgi:putative acetyltransferase